MTIGEKIKTYRRLREFTQKELAELSGVSEISIRKYEAGERIPKSAQIKKIAQALDLEDVFNEEPYKAAASINTVGDAMALILLLEEKIGFDYSFKSSNYYDVLKIEPETLTIRFKNEKIQIYMAQWVEEKIMRESHIKHLTSEKNRHTATETEHLLGWEDHVKEMERKRYFADTQPLINNEK